MRGPGFAAVWDRAVEAGIMASNNGRLTAAPAPRRNKRRDRCFLVMNMVTPSRYGMNHRDTETQRRAVWTRASVPLCLCGSSSVALRRNLTHLERRALHNPHHDGRKASVFSCRIAHDLADCRHVVILDAAAERVHH